MTHQMPIPVREHSPVVLRQPMPALGLKAGSVDVVVHVYPKAAAYEVEIMTAEGRPLGVYTLRPEELTEPAATQAQRCRAWLEDSAMWPPP